MLVDWTRVLQCADMPPGTSTGWMSLQAADRAESHHIRAWAIVTHLVVPVTGPHPWRVHLLVANNRDASAEGRTVEEALAAALLLLPDD